MPSLQVNGEQREVPEGTTLAGLIESSGLGGKACAAEVNKELVPKASHSDTVLAEGDRVELVTLVGGG
ncbi:MAG: sulfur carrier protein ThiS [Planctomycetota bacterium]